MLNDVFVDPHELYCCLVARPKGRGGCYNVAVDEALPLSWPSFFLVVLYRAESKVYTICIRIYPPLSLATHTQCVYKCSVCVYKHGEKGERESDDTYAGVSLLHISKGVVAQKAYIGAKPNLPTTQLVTTLSIVQLFIVSHQIFTITRVCYFLFPT